MPDTDRTTAADVEALRLAQTTDPATVAYVLRRTDAIVSRRLGGSTEETAARADALARALRGVANGLTPEHAVHAACRDAVADAVRRAATDDLLSLDATTAETGTTLADLLSSGGIGTARLSHYDDAVGVWRGVARVPHPTDVLRPQEMPAPEQMQEVARDRLTAEARTLLDLTIAANVAALPAMEAEWTAVLDEQTADHADAIRASRSRRAAAIAKAINATKQARRDARKSDRVAMTPRTTDVAAALGITSRGRATQAIGTQQEAAARAYWTHRDEMAAQALEAATDRLDYDAERARTTQAAREALEPWTGQPLSLPHAARMTTHQAIAKARTAAHAATAQARRANATGDRIGSTHQAHRSGQRWGYIGRYAADNGAPQPATRPRIGAPWEWTPGKALPGPSRKQGSRLPQPTDPAADPTRSRAEALAVTSPQPARVPRHDDHSAIAWHACDGVRLPEQPAPPARIGTDLAPVTFEAIAAAVGIAAWPLAPLARPWSLDATRTAPASPAPEPRPLGRTRAEAEAATATA